MLAGKHAEGPWNFGPADAAILPVREMVAQMQSHWLDVQVEPATGQHPHEAAILMLDSSKAASELHWKPVWNAETGIGRTIDWYRAHHLRGELRSREDLDAYVDDARSAGLSWVAHG
jgi:CDP-glucose 4,6-dehydratase